MIKTYSQAKSIVENKFLTSSYITSRVISGGNKYFPEEVDYWAKKIINSNWSETLFNSEFNKIYASNQGVNLSGIRYNDHIGQTIYVDSNSYPNGLFLSSIGIFFSSVDPTSPITLELRPLVNGYPSSNEADILPLSIVSITPNPKDTITPPLTVDNATKFEFDFPVYLAPGYYCFTLKTNSSKYNLYMAERGLPALGSTTIVTNPYIGAFVTSQQGVSWTVEQTKDLCFVLYRASFGIGTKSFTINTDQEYFDFTTVNLKMFSQEFDSLATINSISANTLYLDSNQYVDIVTKQNKNVDLSQIGTANTSSGIIYTITMFNKDERLSPLINLHKTGSVLVKNKVDPYNTYISYSELTSKDGLASAKYITKMVTLNEDFDADGLTVYIDTNKPLGTYIEVFYKVLNKYDFSTPFNNLGWTKMTLITPVTQSSDTVTFDEETYQNLNITYTNGSGTLYTDFKYFAIKMVMYSDNPCVVPRIRNFRAIATI